MIYSVLGPGALTDLIMSQTDVEKVMVDNDVQPLNDYISKVKLKLVKIKETPCSDSAKWDAMSDVLEMCADTFEEISDGADYQALTKVAARFKKLRSRYRRRYQAF